MNSLYLSSNRIADIAPLLKLQKLWSLYLDHNQVESLKGIGALKRLSSLSLSQNKISDTTPLQDLNGLYHLFLDNNKIKDITPLFNAAKKDYEGEKRFVPFINIYVAGNPLSSASKKQLATLKDYGARVHD